MRLMEVGTKMQTKGDIKGAEDLFKKSYNLYSLFWGLNLGIVDKDQIEINKSDDITLISEEEKPQKKGSIGIFDKLGQIVKSVIDCCKE